MSKAHWNNLKILKKHSFIFVILTIFFAGTPYIVYPSEKKSVAIATFQNLTKDKEIDWIGTGFAETLTTKLINIKSIRVFERNQMAKLLEEIKLNMTGIVDAENAVQAGKFIGVDYMVIGSFQKVNERIMVTARLVDVETGEVEKSASVKGNYKDLFELQEELTLKLATTLEAPISEEEKTKIAKPPAKTLSAYEWFAKGKDYLEKAGGGTITFATEDYFEAMPEAISCFNKAIELDIEYAPAYYFRGWILLTLATDYKIASFFAFLKEEKSKIGNQPIGEERRQQLLKICDEGENVSFTMSLYDKAIEDFTRTIELDPRYTDAYSNRGEAYAGKGLYDLAIEDYTKAIELEPKPEHWVYQSYSKRADAYKEKGLYDKAISDYTRVIELYPRIAPEYLRWRGIVYRDKGLYDEAINDFTKAIELYPVNSSAYRFRGLTYKDKGLDKLAIADLKRAVDLGDSLSSITLKEDYNIDYEKK